MKSLIDFFRKIPYRTKYFFKVLFLYKNPFSIFSIALFPDPKKIVKLHLRGGFVFFVRKMLWDFFVLNEIFVKKEYSVLEKDFSNAKTIIDVGAHIGAFSVFFAKRFEGAKVFCFEPMPDNFKLLSKNISLNNLSKKVFPFNVAVVGKKKQNMLPLYICEENPACNSLDKDYAIPGSKEVFVKIISFSEIFLENNISTCDILKLDCENVELEIIRECKEEFSKIKSVILEYHDPKKLSQIKALLEGYGFEFFLLPKTILAYGKRKD